eukprot:7951644-Pyramimonas_sp.AAC.1
MAQLMGAIRLRMLNPHRRHLRRAGVEIDYGAHGDGLRLHTPLGIMLGDEAALHSAWLCKGSGWTKCRMQCLNIVNKNWLASDELEAATHLIDVSK